MSGDQSPITVADTLINFNTAAAGSTLPWAVISGSAYGVTLTGGVTYQIALTMGGAVGGTTTYVYYQCYNRTGSALIGKPVAIVSMGASYNSFTPATTVFHFTPSVNSVVDVRVSETSGAGTRTVLAQWCIWSISEVAR